MQETPSLSVGNSVSTALKCTIDPRKLECGLANRKCVGDIRLLNHGDERLVTRLAAANEDGRRQELICQFSQLGAEE